jgi:hypothetical protein
VKRGVTHGVARVVARTVAREALVVSLGVALGVALVPRDALAQVGYPPAESPFRDIDTRLRVGLFAGPYIAAKDPAGVMPRGGTIFGARMDMHVGGPGDLTFRLGIVPTDRREIDPTRSAGERVVGTRDFLLTFADVGIAFHLTGNKSWHNIAPTLNANVGIVTDFDDVDPGGYQHGATFSLFYGAGVRYLPPGRRLTFRVELGSYLYSLTYPTTYYTPAGDGSAVLDASVKRGNWRNNWVILLGGTYRVFR